MSAVANVGSEPCEDLTGVNHIARTAVDRAHDRVSSGWTTIVAERATTMPERLHPVTGSAVSIISTEHASSASGQAARDARHRHVDDGGGGRLILQDDRQGRILPVIRRG